MTEKQWIEKIAPLAVAACRTFGLYLPSVLIAQTCQETGYGSTDLSQPSIYNVVGMKKELLNSTWRSNYWHGETYSKITPEWYGGVETKIRDTFRVYSSYSDCLCDYLQFLRDCKLDNGKYKYRDCLTERDYYRLIESVRSRGYCTDPAYSKSIKRIIEKHDLTKYDRLVTKTNEGGSTVGKKSYKSVSEFLAVFGRTLVNRVAANRGSVPAHNANSHKYLAIHYLGVNGDNPDLYDGGYGGHWYVRTDGSKIYQAALPTDKLWHVGASSGYRYIHDDARNTNTVGIEIGTYTASGKNNDNETWYFTPQAQEAAACLAAAICSVYHINPDTNLLRHGDITTKNCPSPYKRDAGKGTNWTWSQFKTRVRYYMEKAEAIEPANPVLRKGAHGEHVVRVQECLWALGFCDCVYYNKNMKPKFVDSSFGGTTEKAVRSFQSYCKLKTDGVVGTLTWAAIAEWEKKIKAAAITVTLEEALGIAAGVAKEYRQTGYKYGNAPYAPQVDPDNRIVSCDRGIDSILFRCGLVDVGNRGVNDLKDYLIAKGCKSVAVNQYQAGDVIFMNGHVYMLGHKRDNGAWERYDFGSQARIDAPMPSVEAVTGVIAVVRPTYKVATVDKRTLIRRGQQAINNILVGERIVWTIAEDGVFGSETRMALKMVLQICLNKDYGQRLKIDGDIAAKSEAAIRGHYIKKGETQWLVTYAEIAAYLNGKNPNGIEMPGHYGSGLEKALGKSYMSWTELLAFVR